MTFDDGTTATGSFTYDAVLDDYSNWNLVVEPAAFMPGHNYLPAVDGGFAGIHDALAADFVAFRSPPPPSGRYLRLVFANPLTDAGGVAALALGGVSWECDNCSTKRLITGGSVTGVSAPVPEPAPLALIPGALFVGQLLLRRHARRG